MINTTLPLPWVLRRGPSVVFARWIIKGSHIFLPIYILLTYHLHAILCYWIRSRTSRKVSALVMATSGNPRPKTKSALAVLVQQSQSRANSCSGCAAGLTLRAGQMFRSTCQARGANSTSRQHCFLALCITSKLVQTAMWGWAKFWWMYNYPLERRAAHKQWEINRKRHGFRSTSVAFGWAAVVPLRFSSIFNQLLRFRLRTGFCS